MTSRYPHTSQTKDALKDMADFVQRDGLNYLVPAWQRFASEAETEESIYEWLNDLDTRKIIDEILDLLPGTERSSIEQDLKPADDEVIRKTFEIDQCVWGDVAERENHYNKEKNWYYYRMNQSIFDNEDGRFTKRLQTPRGV